MVSIAMSWAWALNTQDRPTAFGLTRQGIPEIARDAGFDQEYLERRIRCSG